MATDDHAAAVYKQQQRSRLELRQSTRQLKKLYTSTSTTTELTTTITTEQLRESERALQKISQHISSTKSGRKEIEAILGTSLPVFVTELQIRIESVMAEIPTSQTQTQSQSLSQMHGDGGKKLEYLQHMRTQAICISTTLRDELDAEARERREWELAYPVQASQERELLAYTSVLCRVLLLPVEEGGGAKVMNRIAGEDWAEAEECLRGLETYLVGHEVAAAEVRRGRLEETLRDSLQALRELDEVGVDRQSLGEVIVGRLERIWGLVDKIGSGVAYLLKLDAAGQKPTTKSVFLLKSAPPATFRFSTSKDEWRERKLREMRDRLVGIILDPDNPIEREDESRWNAAYQELEHLEEFLQGAGKGASVESIKKSEIDETIRVICARLEALHLKRKAGEDETQFALMHVSWELAMRLGESFASMHD